MGGFGKPIHHNQDGGVAIRWGKTREIVQGEVGPGTLRDRQRLEEISRSLSRSHVLRTNRASGDEYGDIRDHGRPPKALSHKIQGPTGVWKSGPSIRHEHPVI